MHGRKLLTAMLCGIMLLFCGMYCVGVIQAAAETSTVTTISETMDNDTAEDEQELSKTMRIVQFLVIFTIAMGTTAYLVVRPKLKLLKDMKHTK